MKPAVEKTSRRKLSISHVLLWITASAIYIGFIRSEDPNFKTSVTWLFEAAFTGVAWSGLVMVLTWKYWSRESVEPGAWFLFTLGFCFACDTAIRLWPDPFIVIPNPVFQALSCVAFVIPLLSRKLALRWKVIFGILTFLRVTVVLLATANALSVSHRIPDNTIVFVEMARNATGFIGPILGIAPDWKQLRRFSWLHWLGICFFCLYSLFCLIHSMIS